MTAWACTGAASSAVGSNRNLTPYWCAYWPGLCSLQYCRSRNHDGAWPGSARSFARIGRHGPKSWLIHPYLLVYILLHGQIARLENDLPGAVSSFEGAASVAHEIGKTADEIGALTFLGEVYLALYDPAAALQATTRAAELHRAQSLGKIDSIENQEIWWQHSRALTAGGQPEAARAALAMAYQFLLDGIASLSDEGLRRNYLNKIKANRAIIAAWLAQEEDNDLAAKDRYAHLGGAADLKEPFQRLVDTGLRLNELRTAAELHDFLIEEVTELSGAERVLLILEGEDGRELAGSLLPTGEDDQNLLAAIAELLDEVRHTRTVLLQTAENPADPNPSRIIAPLIAQRQLLGYLYADMGAVYGSFGQTDRDLLGMLAGQAAVALDNARWGEGLEQKVAQRTAELDARVQELSVISTVSQALVAEPDLAKLITLIGSQTCQVFNADIAYLALLDRQSNLIQFPYQYGEPFRVLELGEGMTSKIIETGEPLLINSHMDDHQTQMGAALIGKKALSYLGVPIKSSQGTIGVLSVQSTRQEDYFDEDSLRLLETIAANAGAAIHTARLHTETIRRAEEMAALAEIGTDIATTLELEPVLERIARRAKELLHVRDIAIYLREGDGDTFRAPVALGEFTAEMMAESIHLGEGLTGAVAQNGTAEVINYPERDPRAVHIPGTPDEEEVRESMMVAPLISRERVIGIVTVWRLRERGLFNSTDLQFLENIARQSAIAIESARLYLETQRRASEMAVLAEVGREITATLDLTAVLEQITTHAQELLHADSSAVFLPTLEQPDMYEAIAAMGDIAGELMATTIASGEGIMGDIARKGVAEVVNDTNSDPRADHDCGHGRC